MTTEETILTMKKENKTWREIGEAVGKTPDQVRGWYRRHSDYTVSNVEDCKELPRHPQIGLKAAVFDLETMDFDSGGWTGHLVCCSIFPLDADKPYTLAISFEDNRDDRRLLNEVITKLSEYEILIGHNIRAFDLNWLYSRAMYHGIHHLPDWITYDTYQSARAIAIKVESKSLGALGSFFGLKGEKTRVFKTDWSKVDSPNYDEFKDALDNVVDHCEKDVELNRRLFDVMWAYDPQKRLTKTKW